MKDFVYDARFEAEIQEIDNTNAAVVACQDMCNFDGGELFAVGTQTTSDPIGKNATSDPIYMRVETCRQCGLKHICP